MGSSDITVTRIVKCAISFLVFIASSLFGILARFVRRKPKGSCVVLYYHSVPPEQREQFANQLDSLLRLTQPIALEGDIKLIPGVRHSAITFDDAFVNFVDVAFPELQKRNICSTMFVISEALGKTFGPAACPERVMSQQQLLNLPRDLVIIGSHTLSHPMLTRIEEEKAREEIVHSRFKLEQMLGRNISSFSFPFGDFNQRLVEICKEAGYKRVFTTLPRFAFSGPEEFAIGRVRVDPTDWPIEFRLKIAGAYCWLPVEFKLKRGLCRLFNQKIRSAEVVGQISVQSMIHEPCVGHAVRPDNPARTW